MASDRGRGQFPICCPLCETKTKVEFKCMDCKLLMCKQCKEKTHLKFKNAKDHTVISVKDIGAHEEKIDFSDLKCDNHKTSCCFYCTTCDVLVCPRCILKDHKEHNMAEINERYDLIKSVLQNDKEDCKNHLLSLSSITHNLNQLKKVHATKMSNEILKIKRHGDELKSKIDESVVEISNDVKREYKSIIHSIEEDMRELATLKESFEKTAENLLDQIHNTDAKTFFKFGCNYTRSTTKTLPTSPSLYLTAPEFIPNNVERLNVGDLQSTSGSYKEINEIKKDQIETYTSNLSFISAILPRSDETVLLSSYLDETVQLVKLDDNRLDVLKSYNKIIYDVGITSSNKILVSVEGEKRLKYINVDTGKLSNSVYDVTPLQPRNFSITKSDGVIVRALNDSRGKGTIIFLDTNGRTTRVFDKDEENDSLFMYPLLLAQTSNQLIHVVDCGFTSSVGKITVTSEDGRLYNTYCGHPDVNREILFRPQGLTVTPQDNVLVADQKTHYLHLLNNIGYIISVINVGTIGVYRPVTLQISPSGILYIGCDSEQIQSKDARFCVLKSLGDI